MYEYDYFNEYTWDYACLAYMIITLFSVHLEDAMDRTNFMLLTVVVPNILTEFLPSTTIFRVVVGGQGASPWSVFRSDSMDCGVKFKNQTQTT